MEQNGCIKLLIGYIFGKEAGGRVYARQTLLMNLKRVHRNSNFQSNEPLLILPYNKPYLPQGQNLQNYSRALVGLCWPLFFYLIFKLVWTKWLSQNFEQVHLGKKRSSGGQVALRLLLTLKKGTKTSHLQSKFMLPSLP